MRRLRTNISLWCVLFLSVFMKNIYPSSIRDQITSKATELVPKRQIHTSTTLTPTREASSRLTSLKARPKSTAFKQTTSISTTPLPLNSVTKKTTSPNKKKLNYSITTLSPTEIMNNLYAMHGLASHSVSNNHPKYNSNSTASEKKKEQSNLSSSMDDIYQLHALAMSQSSPVTKKTSAIKNKNSDSSNSKQKTGSQYNSMEQIYQQHSSLPSSMHHVLSQHSVQSQHVSVKPQKTAGYNSHNPDDSSALSTIMQPLLKQLTPVGAGIGIVLAPLLLFNGFLQFFSNMSRFLNNFAQNILPVRKPNGQNIPNTNSYFQNLDADHLKRQPRDWLSFRVNIQKINELTELFLKAVKNMEVQ